MFVLLDDQATQRQLYFTQPKRVLTHRLGDPVDPLFAAIEQAQADGLWLAGVFHYEFAADLEARLSHLGRQGTETVRLGVFDPPSDYPPASLLYRASPLSLSVRPAWTEAAYVSRFKAVQDYLISGDCYQVNLTFPTYGETDGDAAALYASLRRRQPGRYGAIVSLYEPGGGPDIISFSPELFFEKRGRTLRMRPMKGTRPIDAEDDMRADEKSRAENLMIVDLLRNDLSRLSVPGSVNVPELFAVEDYPTVRQMTSQVTGTLRKDVGWRSIFRALFPCGSVTGAPKIRAMEIINDLEAEPRGPYCGAIGFIAPDGDATFSVAIRTARLQNGQIRYDVGSGVVLDSMGPDEYRECLLKADILSAPAETQFETVRNGPNGVVRADRHAARLGLALPDIAPSPTDQRVRIDRIGQTTTFTQAPFAPIDEPIKLVLSRYALTPDVQKTTVKTSNRDFYDGERLRVSALCGADEVIFADKTGRLKEGSFTTLFIQMTTDASRPLLTPAGPGLLPGVLRAEMLERGQAVTTEITLDDLMNAHAIFVGNSLRGLMRAALIGEDPV
jgi:para-aminobenzoate synthetase/4-amino-4-deoxychorismate lyase